MELQWMKMEYGDFERVVGLGLGEGEGQMKRPSGVAVDGDGKIYVADTNNHRVQVFSGQENNFAFERVVGEGQLNYPRGVAVDWNRAIVVADMNNVRVLEDLHR